MQGQVGYWLRKDPSPESIENQEYGEKELNTLVKKYKENEMKNIHFEQEKERKKWKKLEEGKTAEKFEDTIFKKSNSSLEEEYKKGK